VYHSEREGSEIPGGVIHITKGYSKDNVPQLNQVVVQLICAHRSSIPPVDRGAERKHRPHQELRAGGEGFPAAV